jgi:guanylate kinase
MSIQHRIDRIEKTDRPTQEKQLRMRFEEKNFFGDEAMSIFIQPPSVEELRKRLVARQTDSADMIETRIAKAEYELTFAERFDVVIINDVLEDAYSNALTAVKEFLNVE